MRLHFKGTPISKGARSSRPICRHCVVQGAQLLALSGDFAHLLLFKELQRSGEIANPHERAGLRLQAFWQGYEDGHGGIEEASQV